MTDSTQVILYQSLIYAHASLQNDLAERSIFLRGWCSCQPDYSVCSQAFRSPLQDLFSKVSSRLSGTTQCCIKLAIALQAEQ